MVCCIVESFIIHFEFSFRSLTSGVELRERR